MLRKVQTKAWEERHVGFVKCLQRHLQAQSQLTALSRSHACCSLLWKTFKHLQELMTWFVTVKQASTYYPIGDEIYHWKVQYGVKWQSLSLVEFFLKVYFPAGNPLQITYNFIYYNDFICLDIRLSYWPPTHTILKVLILLFSVLYRVYMYSSNYKKRKVQDDGSKVIQKYVGL